MNRTFRHRIAPASVVMLAILVGVSMYVLLHRSAASALLGLALAAGMVVVMERLLHTEYRFEGDRIVIDKGRFARPVSIPVNDIIHVRMIDRKWLLVRYVLIVYGAGHETAVQPMNENLFMEEIRKRQKRAGTDQQTDEE
ncbi:MAG: PH domain-containing protein [Prevotellaceae bacterium]|nr:PH domain-containing protein [Prevotella sp.]MDD7256944.1 PH domain-containing protein [Prevotellaceae bacterium]MDY6131383.1 PH domain-containing protein [Prevotella sp.]